MSHYPISIFKFRQLNGITVSDDGLTLECNKLFIYHSIRFGQFLHKNEEIIFLIDYHCPVNNHSFVRN